MELLIKAAVMSVVAALTTMVIRRSNPELSLALVLAVAAAVLALGLELFFGVRALVDMTVRLTGLSAAFVVPVLKCVGISVITKLTTELCRDAGAGAVASSVELTGAACALYVALPLLETLLRMLENWL